VLADPELVLEAVVLPEVEELALELPAPCSTTVPIVVGLAGCGVTVRVLPDTQYEYFVPPALVSAPLAAVYMSLVVASIDTTPSPPVWATVAEHVQPPALASVQVIDA
jgi:hypothetical protein